MITVRLKNGNRFYSNLKNGPIDQFVLWYVVNLNLFRQMMTLACILHMNPGPNWLTSNPLLIPLALMNLHIQTKNWPITFKLIFIIAQPLNSKVNSPIGRWVKTTQYETAIINKFDLNPKNDLIYHSKIRQIVSSLII